MKPPDTHTKMKLFATACFLPFIFLFKEVNAEFDINEGKINVDYFVFLF
jgi:hypothetical protein